MGTVSTVLQARGLQKAFGHVQALEDVTFDVQQNEILIILGDNGAGKSTLIKTLSGLYRPDAGTITVNGKPQHFSTPGDAIQAGIATVYQDLALVDTRDVAANLYLGREFMRGPFVDRRRGRREAEQIIRQLGVKLPSVRVPVSLLSGGQRQAVAVARTMVQGANIIIMDEPTAALGVTESNQVLRLITDLRAKGKSVIVISHNLQQVWDIADRFLVMRLGHVAGIRAKAETTVDDLVKLIVYGDNAFAA
jgi:ABC-type sugar transport system ATPase subunit